MSKKSIYCRNCGNYWSETVPESEANIKAEAMTEAVKFFFCVWLIPMFILGDLVGLSFIWFSLEISHFLSRVGLTWCLLGWFPSLLFSIVKHKRVYSQARANEICETLAEKHD